MKKTMIKIFPESANNHYSGSKTASVMFLLIALVGIIRSCIHIFSADGGAGSIAGMDLTVPGAEGIIFAFSLWGSAQLLYALIQLLIYFKYKTLIPFMYIIIIIETFLRMLVGHIKPVYFAHTPPGQIGNYIMIPLCLILLFLSLKELPHTN